MRSKYAVISLGALCVIFTAAGAAIKAPEVEEMGFVPLVKDSDLTAWIGDACGYRLEDGIPVAEPEGNLHTQAERADCVLVRIHPLKPVGEWNTQEIRMRRTKVRVTLNGTVIVDAELTPFREGMPPPDGKEHPGLKRNPL